MSVLQNCLVTCSVLLAAATLPAHAASSAASSASDSLSTSVGSLSTSIGQSSNSSSPDKEVADGNYRVQDVADAADRPGMVRLTMQPLAAAEQAAPSGEFYLYLPRQTVDQTGMVQGAVVTARKREFGLEFARAETRAPFFLVLRDDWFNELASRPVTL